MDKNTIDALKNGEVVVIPTDTIYGIVGQALNRKTVERIYNLKNRAPQKPCIILISDISDLEKFGISVDEKTKEVLDKVWPGEVSVILECQNPDLEYLHRGTNTIAFRLPKDESLQEVLKETGPLIAPSANIEGYPNAKNIEEAKNYFGENIQYYVDAGELISEPSTLIKITDGKIEILRQGKIVI